MSFKITIDGREVEANSGETLLEVCRREDIDIPTMCHNEELEPYAVCRLCIVEWDRGDWSKIVTACNFPVKEGQKLLTNSEKIQRQRRMIMEFMLARSSKTPEVIEMAKRLGVSDTRFDKRDDGCIMCGMCVRACEEVVGTFAITFADRGPQREVSSPFFKEANDCIGCGSCAYICPTNFIQVEETEETRKFPQWRVEFEFARCKKCGVKIAPKKQLEFIQKRVELPKDWFDVCQACR